MANALLKHTRGSLRLARITPFKVTCGLKTKKKVYAHVCHMIN